MASEIVLGPSVFAYYPNIEGRQILLLGEFHVNQHSKLPSTELTVHPIHQWLYRIATQTNQELELYVEAPLSVTVTPMVPMTIGEQPLPPEKRPLESYLTIMTSVTERFGYQLDLPDNHHHPDLPKVIYHQVDVRQYQHRPNTLILLIPVALDPPTQIRNTYGPHKRGLFEYILGYNVGKQIFHQYLRDMCKFGKLSYKRTRIEKMMHKYLFLIQRELSNLSSNLDKTQFMNTLLEVAVNMDAPDLFLELHLIQMDAYCLIKMFSNTPIRKALVYTGINHTRFYLRFIEQFFHLTPSIAQTTQTIDDPQYVVIPQSIISQFK
jgi:hypothetical protein